MDYNAELDKVLAKGSLPSGAPEAAVEPQAQPEVQDYNATLDRILGQEQKVAPSPMSGNDASPAIGQDFNRTLDEVLARSRNVEVPYQVPSEQEDVTAPQAPALPSAGSGETPVVHQSGEELITDPVSKPGPLEAFTGGIKRGVGQVAAMPSELAGIAAEALGNEQAAEEAFRQARRIESYSGPSNYTWDDVNDASSFASWLAEKTGEQLPILGSMMTGAGGAALAAQLTGKMLLKRSVSRLALGRAMTVGGTATGVGLETAGTGSELKQATGSYNPGTAVAAGVAKGILEFYGPAKLIKGLANPGSTVAGEAVKFAMREGLTEGSQELIDATARAFEDENYEFWSRETFLRTRESALAGFFVGGGIGVVGKAGTKALGLEQGQKPGTNYEIDPNTIPPPDPETEQEVDWQREETWFNPLTWLRRKYGKQSKVTEDALLEPTDVPAEDYSEAGTIFAGVRRVWETAGIEQDQVDAILDFEDAVKPRYFITGLDGKLIGRALTDTDAEEVLSLFPQGFKPEIVQADLTQMNAGSLTADVFDLPEADSNRIFFAPHVSKARQEELRQQYALEIVPLIKDTLTMRLRSKEDAAIARNVLDKAYGPLVNAGLRIIPSRGASFIYRGEVTGKPVDDVITSGRMRVLVKDAKVLQPGSMLYPPEAQQIGARAYNIYKEPVTIDFNKVKYDTGFLVKNYSDKSTNYANFAQPGKGFIFKPGLRESEKAALSVELQEFLTQKQGELETSIAESFWQRGIALDPSVFDGTAYVVKNPVGLEKLTPAARLPGAGVAELVIKNNQVNKGFSLEVNPVVSVDLKHFAKTNPEFHEQVKEVYDTVLEAAPVLEQLGKELGLGDFTIKVLTSVQGVAAWDYANRALEIGIGSIVYNHGPDGVMARGSDLKLSTWRTLLHEFGHGITLEHYGKLPGHVKSKLRVAYERARLYARLTGLVDKSSARVPGSTTDVSHPSYYLQFHEWLAEQFVRWSFSTTIPRTRTEKFYKDMADRLEKAGKIVIERAGLERASNILNPSWQFSQVVEYLREAQRGVVNPMIARVEVSGLDALPAMEATLAAIQEFRKLIPQDVTVDVRPETTDREAEFWNNGRVLRLWVGTLSETRFDPRRVVAHEAVHASWKMFTEQERALLVAEARKANVLKGENLAWYTKFYSSQGATKDQVQSLLDEERVAWMIDARVGGAVFSPQVNGLLDALIEVFRRIKNLLNGFGYQTINDVQRAFFNGEIAQRANPPASASAILLPRLATDGRQNWIKPEKIIQVEPNLFMAVEYLRADGGPITGASMRFYLPGEGPLSGTLDEQLMQLGEEVGFIDTTYYGELKGYDVDMVKVHDKFHLKTRKQLEALGGETYVQKFTKYGEAELGRPFRASGVMTQAGYRSRMRRTPDELKYHVFDSRSQLWYSPNYIVKKLGEFEQTLRRVKREKNQRAIKAYEDILTDWKKLKARVPPEAWNDPGLGKMFAVDPKVWEKVAKNELLFGTVAAESQIDENKMVKMVRGEEVGPTTSPFDQIDTAAKREQIKQNAKSSIDPELAVELQPETELLHAILPRGESNPQVDRHLSGQRTDIPGEADRISRFSKLLMGIQQIAWRNTHIKPLQVFVSLINQMQAVRMNWIARADTTVKDWDRQLDERNRAGLTEMLFWATEMEYLSQQERQAGVVRHPTSQELQRYVTQNRLDPAVLQFYDRIQGDFVAFLADVERVSAKNIQRQFGGPNQQAQLQSALAELQADMRNMKARPYFPMVRFGEFTLTIRDPGLQGNDVIHFSAYPTEAERDAAVRQHAQHNRGMRMQVGRVTEDLHEFMGLPAPLLRAIKNMPGLNQTQLDWIDQFVHQSSPERSFRKRWLRRKGTDGYSLDGMRVYSHYFLSGANYLSRLDFKDELTDQIQAVRNSFTGLRDTTKRSRIVEAMQTSHKFIMQPGRDWAKFKAFVSIWQLGASPAAAAMNFLQTPTVTMPYFSGIYGGSVNVLLASLTNSIKRGAGFYQPSNPNPQFDAARLVLKQMGKIDIGQAPELGAYAEGYNMLQRAAGTKAQKAWRQLSHMSMWMFGKAEELNREIAFGMSWMTTERTANHRHLIEIEQTHFTEINGLTGQTIDVAGTPVTLSRDTAIAIVAAREAIDRTQFVYAPWARPGFLRNPLMSSLLVFFQYTQAMIYAFGNNPGRAKMFLIYASLFGLLGLPGADDLDEVLNAVAKRLFGKDFSLEAESRKFVRELTRGTVFDEVGPDLLMHGISRYSFGPGLLQEGYGIPQFDASANGSLGRVVPGLAEAASAIGNRKDWKDLTAEVARDTAGAGFGQMFSLLQFLSSDPWTGDAKKWESVMPRAARALSKASRYYVEERERTKQGGTFVEFDAQDPDDLATIAAQAFGFSPTKINKKWEEISTVNDTLQFYQGRKMSLMGQYSEALMWKEKETMATIRGRILDYNREVREKGFPSLSITSEGLKSSLSNRVRTRQMQTLGLPAQKNQIQVQRKVLDEQFRDPLVEKVK